MRFGGLRKPKAAVIKPKSDDNFHKFTLEREEHEVFGINIICVKEPRYEKMIVVSIGSNFKSSG